jgi:hypothetical protein
VQITDEVSNDQLPMTLVLERLAPSGWVRGRPPSLPHTNLEDKRLSLSAGFSGKPSYLLCILDLADILAGRQKDLCVNQSEAYYSCVAACKNIGHVPPGCSAADYRKAAKNLDVTALSSPSLADLASHDHEALENIVFSAMPPLGRGPRAVTNLVSAVVPSLAVGSGDAPLAANVPVAHVSSVAASSGGDSSLADAPAAAGGIVSSVATGSAGDTSSGVGTRRCLTRGGFRWGVFFFSPVRRGAGPLTGWQVTCNHPLHGAANSSTKCTTTKSFKTPAEEQDVLRFCKWWALQAPQCQNKAEHQALRRSPPVVLPSLESLDRQVFTEWPPVALTVDDVLAQA